MGNPLDFAHRCKVTFSVRFILINLTKVGKIWIDEQKAVVVIKRLTDYLDAASNNRKGTLAKLFLQIVLIIEMAIIAHVIRA